MKKFLEAIQAIDDLINESLYELSKTKIDKSVLYELLKKASQETRHILILEGDEKDD